MVNTNQLLNNFKRVAENFKITDHVQSAFNALQEIVQLTEKYARDDRLANPYYASHGPDHAESLSHFVSEFLIQSNGKGFDANIETLVLIFSSLMLHDIGMSIPGDGLTAQEMHHTQANRKVHDDRSLTLIEEKIIDQLETNLFPAWITFWRDLKNEYDLKNEKNLPGDLRWITFLLARICKSHGDPENIWLNRNSLDTYTSPKTNQEIDFKEVFGSSWEQHYRKVALSSATILSLVDLCDIRANRFTALSEKWKMHADIMPKASDKKAISFMHWASHQISKVYIEEDGITVKIGVMPNSTKAGELHMTLEGAAADCIFWGNKKELFDAIRKYINSNFKGFTIKVEQYQNDIWKLIEKESLESVFKECWPYPEINAGLCLKNTKLFDKNVIFPRWWNCIFPQWKSDILNDSSTGWFYKIGLIRNEGYLVEEVIDLTHAIGKDDNVITVKFVPHALYDEMEYIRDDCFISAIRVARELSYKRCPAFRTVRFASRGNNTFTLLKSKNYKELENSIILLELLDGYDYESDEFVKFAHDVKASSNIIALIFFGASLDKFQPVLDVTGNKLIEASVNLERLNSIGHGKVEDKAPTATARLVLSFDLKAIKPSESSYSYSNAGTWLGILRKGALDAFAELTTSLENKEKSPKALGHLLLISLVDFLNVDHRELSTYALNDEYDAVKNTLRQLNLPSFDNAIIDLPSKLGILFGDKITVKDSSEIACLRRNLAEKNPAAFLVQAVCLYWLWAHARIYNFSAEPLVGDTPPVTLFDSVFRFVLDNQNDSRVRTAVAMRFANALSLQIAKDKSKTIHNFLLTLKNHIADDLCTETFVMLWQMVYIAFRPLSRAFDIPNDAPDVVKIGILEAIASRSDIQDSEMLQKIVPACIYGLISQCKDIKEKESIKNYRTFRCAIIGFDIAKKYYSRGNSEFNLAVANLIDEGERLGWNPYAEYFLSQSDKSPNGLSKTLLREWAEWKNQLYETISQTPTEFMRTQTDEGTWQKVKKLLDDGEMLYENT